MTRLLLWPVTFRLAASTTLGAHRWDIDRARSLGELREDVYVQGWTLHVGPLKVLFGERLRPPLWLRAIERLVLGRCRHVGMNDAASAEDSVDIPGLDTRRIAWCPWCGAIQVDRDLGYTRRHWAAMRTPKRAGGRG